VETSERPCEARLVLCKAASKRRQKKASRRRPRRKSRYRLGNETFEVRVGGIAVARGLTVDGSDHCAFCLRCRASRSGMATKHLPQSAVRYRRPERTTIASAACGVFALVIESWTFATVHSRRTDAAARKVGRYRGCHHADRARGRSLAPRYSTTGVFVDSAPKGGCFNVA